MTKKVVYTLFVSYFFLLTTTVYSQSDLLQEGSVFDKNKEYTIEEIDSITNVLRGYFYEAHYEKVIEIVPNLLINARNINANYQEARLRSLLGNSFIQLDDYDEAFDLFNEGLSISKKRKDTINIISSYINLGNTFIKQNPKRAIGYFKEGLSRSEKTTTKNDLVNFIIHNNLAELYVGTMEVKKAQYHLDKTKSLINSESLKDIKEQCLATIYFNQGGIYLIEERYKEAATIIEKSILYGKGVIDENYIIGNYKNLMQAYDHLGKYEKVNEIRKIYEPLINKRYEEDKIKQQKIAASRFLIDEFKQELRASQLENELALQKAERSKILLQFSSAVAGILILLIAALLYSRFKRKKLLKDVQAKNLQYLAAKEESEKLAKSNTKFLSTISHELRTPLYGIIGLSSVFLKDPSLESHAENLKSLKFSADYLLALVNDVLHLNKFSSKEGEKMHQSHFKLNDLISKIVKSFEFITKKNNNILTIDIDKNIPEVLFGDKTKLSQVIMNLVSNASKFTQDGTVKIAALLKSKTESSATVLFTIADSGQGIPEEEQSNIFNEFTQVETFTEQQGTGLGLPIVNTILNVLNSKLHLESELGKGSTFSFELTLQIGSVTGIKTAIDKSGYTFLNKKKILIVDDNKINQIVTQKVLEQYGMLHQTANNGQEALDIVQQDNSFDVILMDINMPVMDGIESSTAIRALNIQIPIIALTATAYNNGNDTLENYGINSSIIKPYKTEDLLSKLLTYTS